MAFELIKVSELPELTTPSDPNVIPIQDGDYLKRISFENLKEAVTDDVADDLAAEVTARESAVSDEATARGNADAAILADLASAYSASATYAVGDYCIKDGQLYRCTTAISTAEAWTAAHWSAVALGDDTRDLRSALSFTNSYIIDEEAATLPNEVKGNFKIDINAEGDMVISGTHNVIGMIPFAQGTFVSPKGVTFTVFGSTITITGTATGNISYSLVDGEEITTSTIATYNLPIPDRQYTLSSLKTSSATSENPVFAIRSKSSGNYVATQNNAVTFEKSNTTCGGLYIYITNGKTYNITYMLSLLPFSASNSSPYRSEASDIDVYEQSGTYALDGYTWAVGSPTVAELKSKLPKKPLCKYSTRTIAYSLMTECLDVYVPAKEGYVNYVFGRTQNDALVVGRGDVWRLVQVDAVSDALAFRYHITQLGETEMAIKIYGRDDFIGGTTHGDEVMDADSLVFSIDGKIVDITTITILTEFESLKCFLVSDLYDPNDHTTQVGEHGREWVFDESGLAINQYVKFLANLTMSESYMPMICALRGNDTASDLQITDVYIDDGNYQQYDVGTGGFTTYPNQLKAGIKRVNLFGEENGINITVDYLEQPTGLNYEGNFLYNGMNTYNKLYNCLCGYGNTEAHCQAVNNGDKWIVKSKISVDIAV